MPEYRIQPTIHGGSLGPPITVDGAVVPSSFDASVSYDWGPTLELSICYRDGLWRVVFVGLRGSEDFPDVVVEDRRRLASSELEETVRYLVHIVATLPLSTVQEDREVSLGTSDRAAFRTATDRRQKQRRGSDPTAELREVAAIYRAADPAKPIKAVAERLNMSRATATRRVAEARAEGLLDPKEG